MASCLGLYIEENVIKYAKITKDNDVIKIDAFGIKFYDKLDTAIEQVIEETYSYKTPISINTTNEIYNYFYIFSLLNSKDMRSYIDTEFESICFENQLNVNTFETRHILVDDLDNKEKIKAIHVSVNKGELLRKTDFFSKYKLANVAPVSISISNLLEISKSENVENIAIVNIENSTTVTSIINQKIYDITTIDDGISEILKKINLKENSYAKAYEICKNSTIYTSAGKDLQYEENAYLDDIMPTLYNIVGQVKKVINNSNNRIDKVLITGMASVINNIDIYFQEYLEDVKCEILKPYFIHSYGTEINIKDYIEVNSAIALALQGLGEGIKGINFKKESMSDKLPAWLKIEVGGKSNKENGKEKDKEKEPSKIGEFFKRVFGGPDGKAFDFSLKGQITKGEKILLRSSVAILLCTILYVILSIFVYNQIDDKVLETAAEQAYLQSQEGAMLADKSSLDRKSSEYKQLTQSLEERMALNTEDKRFRYSIPTLLNKIMSSIPTNVQLTEISHSGTKITMTARSERLEALGMFIAKLKNDAILNNVISDTARIETINITEGEGEDQKQVTKDLAVVTIEGELP